MKVNKEFILKNLMTIICGITIIALFFPFIGVSADVGVGGFSANTGDVTFIGYTIISDGGFLGILMELCITLIILSAYLPQLKPYRKIACAASSVIGFICLFIVPNLIAKSINSESGGGVEVKAHISYKFGFWLMLICYVALIAMSVIQFLGLRGNKVFDAINQNSVPNNQGEAAPNAVSERFKNMAQNISENAANAVGNIKSKMSSNTATQEPPVQQAQSVQPMPTVQQAPISNNVSAPVQKGNPEEVMKHIKELYEMKEAGILTEEEFNEKKQEFLKMI